MKNWIWLAMLSLTLFAVGCENETEPAAEDGPPPIAGEEDSGDTPNEDPDAPADPETSGEPAEGAVDPAPPAEGAVDPAPPAEGAADPEPAEGAADPAADVDLNVELDPSVDKE